MVSWRAPSCFREANYRLVIMSAPFEQLEPHLLVEIIRRREVASQGTATTAGGAVRSPVPASATMVGLSPHSLHA